MIDTTNDKITISVHNVNGKYWTGTISFNYYVAYQGMAKTIEGLLKIMGVVLEELNSNTPDLH